MTFSGLARIHITSWEEQTQETSPSWCFLHWAEAVPHNVTLAAAYTSHPLGAHSRVLPQNVWGGCPVLCPALNLNEVSPALFCPLRSWAALFAHPGFHFLTDWEDMGLEQRQMKALPTSPG